MRIGKVFKLGRGPNLSSHYSKKSKKSRPSKRGEARLPKGQHDADDLRKDKSVAEDDSG